MSPRDPRPHDREHPPDREPSPPPGNPSGAEARPSPPRLRPETASRQQLVGAFQEVVKAEAARKAARATEWTEPGTHWNLLALSAVVIALGSYILIARPAWFIAPPPPPLVQPREEVEASLRLGIGREAERVEAYRRQYGKLPATLKEAGGGQSGLRYAPMGTGRYTISGTSDGVGLTYDSIDSIATFVGSSYEVVRQRFKR